MTFLNLCGVIFMSVTVANARARCEHQFASSSLSEPVSQLQSKASQTSCDDVRA